MTDVPAQLAEAVATVRAFAAASGAERVVLLIDRGEERGATIVEGDELGAVQITDGDEVLDVPATAPPGAAPRALPELRPAPPSAVAIDPDTGELEAPLGLIANLARGVLALATAFGGRSVASVDFPTRQPDRALTLAARVGDPLIVAAGEHRFEMPWEALG